MRRNLSLPVAAILLTVSLARLPLLGPQTSGAAASLAPRGYLALIGPLHEHSGYSDGYPGSTPGTYYDSARKAGNDFLVSGEHSDTLDVPIVASEYCLSADLPSCIGGDPDPLRALRKWDAMATYAAEATTPAFTGARGFEWTSDRFGHINVYFSQNMTNAKIDGGYLVMNTFYSWLTTAPGLLGGADGLATFNHPGAKKLQEVGDSDPGVNWNDFAYVPAVDAQFVGIEVYNDNEDFGVQGPPAGYYVHALDKGWHVGAVGAEDLGHRREDFWGGPMWAKTVILATDRSLASLREAMAARRFYAVRRPDTRLAFTVDNALMGTRLARTAGATLSVSAAAVRDKHSRIQLEVVSSGGRVVARGVDRLTARLRVKADEHYYFLRVRSGTEVIGYSSPVWVESAR